MYTLLTLSILCLIAGPLVLQNAQRLGMHLQFLDAFVAVSVGGLIIFHVLPESVSHGGMYSILFFLVGLVGPFLYGYVLKTKTCQLQKPFLLLTVVGLIAHSILDGLALFQSGSTEHEGSLMLGMAIILHRFPEGVGIWRFTRGQLFRRWFYLFMAVVMSSTILGFFFGAKILVHTSEEMLFFFQSVMAGALLHVLFHSHHHEEIHEHEAAHDHAPQHKHAQPRFTRQSLSGAGLGVLLLIAFSMLHPLMHPSHSHDENCTHNHDAENTEATFS